jgi:hypothetical protein
MLLIFSDYHVVDHWIANLELQEPYEICHSLEDYIARENVDKIAFTKGRTFDSSDPIMHDNQKFADFINKLSSVSRLVFSFDTEMHDFHLDIYSACHKNNIYWITSGFFNNLNYSNNIISWMYFFESTARSYKNDFNYKLKELITNYNKPLLFDALLGLPRLHRNFVYNQIKKFGLENKCVLSYQYTGSIQDYQKFWENFIWEPNIVKTSYGQAGTEQICSYDGISIELSKIIPIKIYNRSAYSIVAETNYNNDYSFYTEKTAKPLIAKRIFVMFSGHKMLENLKKLGFKTFDRIIDESYDSIENNEERWTAAFEQILRLGEMNQETVYSTVYDVLEHNHNHIMNIDWMQQTIEKIKSVIYSTNK